MYKIYLGVKKYLGRVALGLQISIAISPLPVGPWASRRTLCTLKVLIIVGIEVETSIPPDPLVLPVSWSRKLAQEGRRMLVSALHPFVLSLSFPWSLRSCLLAWIFDLHCLAT